MIQHNIIEKLKQIKVLAMMFIYVVP